MSAVLLRLSGVAFRLAPPTSVVLVVFFDWLQNVFTACASCIGGPVNLGPSGLKDHQVPHGLMVVEQPKRH